MTIYDSKEDVIETIFLQFGFLSRGLLMITKSDGFCSCVAELKCCLTVTPSAMIWCLLLNVFLNFIITENSQEIWAGVSYPNKDSAGLAETL